MVGRSELPSICLGAPLAQTGSPLSHSLLYPPPEGKYFSASVVINTIERINQPAFFHDGKLLRGTEAMKIWIGRRRLEENVVVRGKGSDLMGTVRTSSVDRGQGGEEMGV